MTGAARAFSPVDLRAIVQALDGISSAELRRRFDPAQMQHLDIYPSIWDRPPEEDDTLGYLIEYYEMLVPFLRRGVAAGLGMIVYLTWLRGPM